MEKVPQDILKKTALIKCIIQAYHRVEFELRNFLKPHGITLQQYNVLKILKGAKQPLTTSTIRARMIEPMTDASRMVERLCVKGWVDRSCCTKDKRLVDVTISQEGIDFIENISGMEKTIESLYSRLSSEEAILLNQLLNKLRS